MPIGYDSAYADQRPPLQALGELNKTVAQVNPDNKGHADANIRLRLTSRRDGGHRLAERRKIMAIGRLITQSLATVGLALISVSASCPPPTPTYGTQWQGDSSDCIGTSPADATVKTIGGDIGGLNQEFGVTTPSYSFHPGCTAAFIIDYIMPPQGTNLNPGWDWAWMHVASRVPNITPDLCGQLWTSLQVYGYWTYQGTAQQKLLLESYRRAHWTDNFCDFGLPDDVWMSSAFSRVRAVSQHGAAFLPLQPHYSYFVTNRGPIP
jgi:hypothetical protein